MNTHHPLESVSVFASKATWVNEFFAVANLMNHSILSHSQEMRWHYSSGMLHPNWHELRVNKGIFFIIYFLYVDLPRDICVHVYGNVCVLGALCIWVQVPMEARRESFGSLGVGVTRVVSHPTWVLEPKFWSSASTVYTVNSRAISPAPCLVCCNKLVLVFFFQVKMILGSQEDENKPTNHIVRDAPA